MESFEIPCEPAASPYNTRGSTRRATNIHPNLQSTVDTLNARLDLAAQPNAVVQRSRQKARHQAIVQARINRALVGESLRVFRSIYKKRKDDNAKTERFLRKGLKRKAQLKLLALATVGTACTGTTVFSGVKLFLHAAPAGVLGVPAAIISEAVNVLTTKPTEMVIDGALTGLSAAAAAAAFRSSPVQWVQRLCDQAFSDPEQAVVDSAASAAAESGSRHGGAGGGVSVDQPQQKLLSELEQCSIRVSHVSLLAGAAAPAGTPGAPGAAAAAVAAAGTVGASWEESVEMCVRKLADESAATFFTSGGGGGGSISATVADAHAAFVEEQRFRDGIFEECFGGAGPVDPGAERARDAWQADPYLRVDKAVAARLCRVIESWLLRQLFATNLFRSVDGTTGREQNPPADPPLHGLVYAVKYDPRRS
eukprot:SAG22_NODE_3332_length_1774_cov_1.635821_1_plen_422_part_01